MLAISMLLQDDGLTVAEIFQDIPHDVPALLVYVLVGVFVFMIWRGNRGQKPRV